MKVLEKHFMPRPGGDTLLLLVFSLWHILRVGLMDSLLKRLSLLTWAPRTARVDRSAHQGASHCQVSADRFFRDLKAIHNKGYDGAKADLWLVCYAFVLMASYLLGLIEEL